VGIRTDTSIADDMLHTDQVLLIGIGQGRDRLGESYLMPAPLRPFSSSEPVIPSGQLLWLEPCRN
jgi:hypothetical protein